MFISLLLQYIYIIYISKYIIYIFILTNLLNYKSLTVCATAYRHTF